MLTLVAAVLAYDCPRDSRERVSSLSALRYAMSDTSEEKDMLGIWVCGFLVLQRRGIRVCKKTEVAEQEW